jgi:DNA topoisomerase VI subunit B
MVEILERITIRTSRLLDFASEKELVAQTGHQRSAWPLVLLKELVDNAIDACEEAGIAPVVAVKVDGTGVTVEDNGPGLPSETIKDVLDFSVRVSSREAYVSPTRGAQGNALKTIVAMPFVIDGERGHIEIEAGEARHLIDMTVDRIRQEPVISHEIEGIKGRIGTQVKVRWPDLPRSIGDDGRQRFLQIAQDYAWLNPHLSITVEGLGEPLTMQATAPVWAKWPPPIRHLPTGTARNT